MVINHLHTQKLTLGLCSLCLKMVKKIPVSWEVVILAFHSCGQVASSVLWRYLSEVEKLEAMAAFDQRKIVLWGYPRCLSTAFCRAMLSRGSCKVHVCVCVCMWVNICLWVPPSAGLYSKWGSCKVPVCKWWVCLCERQVSVRVCESTHVWERRVWVCIQ